jgi:hypothetical protein
MNRINSHSHHQRQSSTGSALSFQDPLQASFSSLDNFLNSTKLMEDEIMVPSKLKEKTIGMYIQIVSLVDQKIKI